MLFIIDLMIPHNGMNSININITILLRFVGSEAIESHSLTPRTVTYSLSNCTIPKTMTTLIKEAGRACRNDTEGSV